MGWIPSHRLDLLLVDFPVQPPNPAGKRFIGSEHD